MRAKKLQQVSDEALRQCVAGGMTGTDIANLYDVSSSAVSKRLGKLGLSTMWNSHVSGGRFHWTPENEAEAKRLFLEGKSNGEIAKALAPNGGLSRNAIIGKTHRLGLRRSGELMRTTQALGRVNASDRAPKATAPKPHLNRKGVVNFQTGPKVAEEPRAFAPSIHQPTGTPARICDDHFSRAGCRWPIGTPPAHDASEQLFCNGVRAEGEARYCSVHLTAAINPNQPKRKLSPPPMGGGKAYRFGERKFAA